MHESLYGMNSERGNSCALYRFGIIHNRERSVYRVLQLCMFLSSQRFVLASSDTPSHFLYTPHCIGTISTDYV
jgi:hypothetical protein